MGFGVFLGRCCDFTEVQVVVEVLDIEHQPVEPEEHQLVEPEEHLLVQPVE